MNASLKLAGMIDPHVHLRDLDWAHKATFASESAAAIAGGYWAIFDMPNTPPATTSPDGLAHKLERINATAYCDWGVYYGAGQTGADPHNADYAVCGLKIYNNATTGNLLITDPALRAEHYQAWRDDRIIAVHAEGETVLDILALVRQYRKRTHFCHISTAEEIEFLRAAKAEGLPISVGVTPHHLYLSEDDLPTLGAFGRMKPELKSRADCAALWAAIDEGLVDVIESDHAPHTLAEKNADSPPFGVPGLETTLPLMALATHENRLTVEQLTALLCTNAQRIWGLTPDAGTYTLVDIDASYIIERANLRSACGWSPFEGMRVYGKVREVWIRGQQVFDGENILAPAGLGRNLFS